MSRKPKDAPEAPPETAPLPAQATPVPAGGGRFVWDEAAGRPVPAPDTAEETRA